MPMYFEASESDFESVRSKAMRSGWFEIPKAWKVNATPCIQSAMLLGLFDFAPWARHQATRDIAMSMDFALSRCFVDWVARSQSPSENTAACA